MNAPKTWFSAAELAGLPGLPGTERAIQLKSARQSWPHRKRAGRGGGREYPLDALPPATRSHLAARIVAAARRAAAGGTAPSGALEPPPPAHSPNGSPPLAGLAGGAKTRAEARLAVLAAFDAFRRAAGCGFRAAEHLFAARYNSAGARAEPDMVSPDVRAELPAVSAASLRNWRRLAAREGAGRLAGRYGTRARNGRIDRNPALRDHILAMLIHQPHLAAHQILAG
ncbi:MAG: hypothetical protein HY057_05945, partial [Rhodospirillales bacterium]|nr:hypothetical protein [Rhodospirillales bacterium]